jgi:indolepyruvate ferredoxin oxidoreductase beta subunit
MKTDIILAGVGGQGVLSIAAVIAAAAVDAGLTARQSEVHGMAQRGGAVLAHLRISDGVIFSDLIPRGGADMIISMEPLESLRYIAMLGEKGALVTAAESFVNIPDYPDSALIRKTLAGFPLSRVVEAERLAKEAGLARAVNMVMVGAASAFLPVDAETLEKTIAAQFAARSPDLNIAAFRAGRLA